MTQRLTHKWLTVAVAGALAFVPLIAEAAAGAWIDEITTLVRDHQELAKFEARERAYDPYLGQLAVVRMAFNRGDEKGVYVAMNTLMDMLANDPKGSGIPTWSAKEIFDFCGKVTPSNFHDYPRHNPALSKGGFDYWDDNVIDFGGGG
jgi:hypothetical protein